MRNKFNNKFNKEAGSCLFSFCCRLGMLCFFSLLATFLAHTQVLPLASTLADNDRTYMNIPSIADFVDRFNGDKNQIEKAGIVIDRLEASDSLSHRGKGILLLFAGDVHRSFADSALVMFAGKLSRDSLFLQLHDSMHLSVAEMNFNYREKIPVKVSLFFKPVLRNNIPSWSIRYVESDFLTYGDSGRKTRIPIPAASIGFINISDYLGGNVQDLAEDSFVPDNLSTFLFLTSHGLLKYHTTQHVEFVFALGGYRFRVVYNQGTDAIRSGYLIDKLWKGEELVFQSQTKRGKNEN